MADEGKLKDAHKSGEENQTMDGLKADGDDELCGLHLHFQQPSSSKQTKTIRPKGRKTTKPVKVSRRHVDLAGEEGDRVIYYHKKDVKAQHSVQHTEMETGGETGPDVNCVSSDPAVKLMKWDKRMRLTITKDFKKERRKSLTGGLMPGDDGPVRRMFTCTVCQQAFLQASDCLQHMYSHTEHMSSDQLEAALQNGEVSMEDATDNAEVKGEDYETEKSIGSKSSTNSCPHCDLGFRSISLLEKHIQQSHAEEQKYWECSSCDKTFLCCGSLNRHRRLEHKGEKVYKCPVCSQCFFTPSSLALHKRNHDPNRPFKCGVPGCDRNFSDASSANRHRRTHSEERPFVCMECGKAFKAQNHLREHTRLHTGERPFMCEICGAGFAQSNGLKSHAKQHRIDRDNQCDVCQKAFSHPKSLALHMKIHSGEKPYTCELCDRTFRTACNLGAHKKLKHIDGLASGKEEKDFTCDICGASFSHACNLGIHKKRKHSDLPAPTEKNFVCDICDMRFSAACNLGAHRKIKHAEQTEEGRSVFDCEICGARFHRACNLSGHKKRKHGETVEIKEADKPFTCTFCNLRCSTLENLQEHQSKIHCSMSPFPSEMSSSQRNVLSHEPSAFLLDARSLSAQNMNDLSGQSVQIINQSDMSLDIPKPESSAAFTTCVTVPVLVEGTGKHSVLNGVFISQPHSGPEPMGSEESQEDKPVVNAPAFEGQTFLSPPTWF